MKLVELLVCCSIVAVLVALSGSAISRAYINSRELIFGVEYLQNSRIEVFLKDDASEYNMTLWATKKPQRIPRAQWLPVQKQP